MPVISLILLGTLAATAALEGAAMAILFHKWKFVYYSLLCNLLTNPPLNLLLLLALRRFGADAYAPALLVLELLAVFVEGYVYRLLCGFSWRKAGAVSALLNALSYFGGVAIQIPFQ